MIRHAGFVLVLLGAGALAACTTTPAMAPSDVAALHSGKIVAVVPRPIVFLMPRAGGGIPVFFPAGSGLFLAISVPVSSGRQGYMQNNGYPAVNTKIFMPYRKQIENLPVPNELVASIRQGSKQVVWIHGPSPVTEYDKSIGSGQMNRMTQMSNVNAVVFVHPVVMFWNSIKGIYILANLSVYAHGLKKAVFLDGGQFVVAVGLGKTRPLLSAKDLEALAAYKSNKQAERQAYAGIWFANDASRLKDALSQGMVMLQRDVNNFLNGRRVRH